MGLILHQPTPTSRNQKGHFKHPLCNSHPPPTLTQTFSSICRQRIAVKESRPVTDQTKETCLHIFCTGEFSLLVDVRDSGLFKDDAKSQKTPKLHVSTTTIDITAKHPHCSRSPQRPLRTTAGTRTVIPASATTIL